MIKLFSLFRKMADVGHFSFNPPQLSTVNRQPRPTTPKTILQIAPIVLVLQWKETSEGNGFVPFFISQIWQL
jgi:hypothetical protein